MVARSNRARPTIKVQINQPVSMNLQLVFLCLKFGLREIYATWRYAWSSFVVMRCIDITVDSDFHSNKGLFDRCLQQSIAIA
jgi:hypothetical protein